MKLTQLISKLGRRQERQAKPRASIMLIADDLCSGSTLEVNNLFRKMFALIKDKVFFLHLTCLNEIGET